MFTVIYSMYNKVNIAQAYGRDSEISVPQTAALISAFECTAPQVASPHRGDEPGGALRRPLHYWGTLPLRGGSRRRLWARVGLRPSSSSVPEVFHPPPHWPSAHDH